MHSRGMLLKQHDQRPEAFRPPSARREAPLSRVASSALPDAYGALCHELSERLTATGNYLGALQRLLEIGYRRGQPLPEEILEKARSEVTRAGEVIHQLRRTLTAHQKS
jgi:hypothetical protein